MNKRADLQTVLDAARSRVGDAGSSISNWYASLNPDMKGAVLRGLAGAATGAAVTGGLASLTPKDPESTNSVLGPALLGAVLGGTASTALPYGMRVLGSNVSLSNEAKRPALARLVDKAVVEPTVSNIGLVGGGLLAAYSPKFGHKNRDAWSEFGRTFRAQKGVIDVPLKDRIILAMKSMNQRMQAGQLQVGPKRMAAIPAALAAGWLADKYIKGEY